MATDTTPTQAHSAGKDATMRYSISCPCSCGQAVQATDAGFSATTVEVAACDKYAAAGIVSTTIRKSAAYQLADQLDREQGGDTILIHRDGLVAFGGAR